LLGRLGSLRRERLCSDTEGLTSLPQSIVILARADPAVGSGSDSGTSQNLATVRRQTAYAPASATYIFDDDGLPKRCPHSLGYDATHRIRRPARGKRDDHRYGTRLEERIDFLEHFPDFGNLLRSLIHRSLIGLFADLLRLRDVRMHHGPEQRLVLGTAIGVSQDLVELVKQDRERVAEVDE
jgi:hypothetical protein